MIGTKMTSSYEKMRRAMDSGVALRLPHPDEVKEQHPEDVIVEAILSALTDAIKSGRITIEDLEMSGPPSPLIEKLKSRLG
jgi:hypothetical protein